MRSTAELETESNKAVPRPLLWVGVAMCALCLAAIIVAEAFMPDNLAGQRAVVTFYRWFGAGFIGWGGVVAWGLVRR
ncbi:MAG: hypothetical protein U0836_20100 [Pirellulales bacterium]